MEWHRSEGLRGRMGIISSKTVLKCQAVNGCRWGGVKTDGVLRNRVQLRGRGRLCLKLVLMLPADRGVRLGSRMSGG